MHRRLPARSAWFARCLACAWAVVQMDYVESEEPWYAVHDTMPIQLEVQRTKEGGLWALHVALGQVGLRASLKHGDTDWLILISEIHHVKNEEDIDFTVRWTEAHRSNKEKRKMTDKQRYLTQGNDKADDLEKLGADARHRHLGVG